MKAEIFKEFKNLKKIHPEAVLLFRCGDFYESYREDADACEKVLSVRKYFDEETGCPFTFFPYHALDICLAKLIRAGHRVAICDETTMPKPSFKEKAKELQSLLTKAKELADGLHEKAQEAYDKEKDANKKGEYMSAEAYVRMLDIKTAFEFLVPNLNDAKKYLDKYVCK